jgi:hypothetical protein
VWTEFSKRNAAEFGARSLYVHTASLCAAQMKNKTKGRTRRFRPVRTLLLHASKLVIAKIRDNKNETRVSQNVNILRNTKNAPVKNG